MPISPTPADLPLTSQRTSELTAAVQSGLEPINPKDRSDRRVPRSTRTDLTNVETEEARAKKQSMLSSAQ